MQQESCSQTKRPNNLKIRQAHPIWEDDISISASQQSLKMPLVLVLSITQQTRIQNFSINKITEVALCVQNYTRLVRGRKGNGDNQPKMNLTGLGLGIRKDNARKKFQYKRRLQTDAN